MAANSRYREVPSVACASAISSALTRPSSASKNCRDLYIDLPRLASAKEEPLQQSVDRVDSLTDRVQAEARLREDAGPYRLCEVRQEEDHRQQDRNAVTAYR